MKKPQFVDLMSQIENLYPGRFKFDENTASIWWEILKDHEFEICRKNLVKHVQVSEWPPAIANLIAGHKDESRTYNQGLGETIESVRPFEEIVKDIEKRTGMKVKY